MKAQNKKYWINREEGDWISEHWKTQNSPHRELVVGEIKKLYPIKNLLEVGCGCGPNLTCIKKELPNISLTGFDINMPSLMFAVKHLKHIPFVYGDVKKLPFADKSYDVILSDAVLMYVRPEEIRKVIQELIRVARKAIVLLELYDPKIGRGIIRHSHWARNYVDLFESCGLKVVKRKIPIKIWPSSPWKEIGYTFSVHLQW